MAAFITKIKNDDGTPILVAEQKKKPGLLSSIVTTFEKIGDNEEITDNKYPKTWDANGNPTEWDWMPGKGKRVFPDAKTPTETTERDTVTVKVQTVLPKDVKVYLRAMDIDDPTPSEMDPDNYIDLNDESTGPEAGEDNRSGRPEFATAGNAVVEGITDVNGLVKVGGELPKLRIGKNPGDNYRIAVALQDREQLDDLQTEDKDAPLYVPSGEEPAPDFNGVLSPMLTVWRRIHVEQDSMLAVPNPKPAPDRQIGTNGLWGSLTVGPNSITTLTCDVSQSVAEDFYAGGHIVAGGSNYPFRPNSGHAAGTHVTLQFSRELTAFEKSSIGTSSIEICDDDDKPLPSGWSGLLPRTNLITNEIKAAFHPAYIDLTDQPENLNDSNVPFVLNMPESSQTLGSDAPSKATITSSTSYWGCTIVAGYQDFATGSFGQPGGDLDPNSDNGGGQGSTLTVNARGVSVIFLEMIRDTVVGPGGPIDNAFFEDLLWQVIAHEIGHNAPGSTDHEEGGIMDTQILGVPGNEFTPRTLDRFRDATQWKK